MTVTVNPKVGHMRTNFSCCPDILIGTERTCSFIVKKSDHVKTDLRFTLIKLILMFMANPFQRLSTSLSRILKPPLCLHFNDVTVILQNKSIYCITLNFH